MHWCWHNFAGNATTFITYVTYSELILFDDDWDTCCYVFGPHVFVTMDTVKPLLVCVFRLVYGLNSKLRLTYRTNKFLAISSYLLKHVFFFWAEVPRSNKNQLTTMKKHCCGVHKFLQLLFRFMFGIHQTELCKNEVVNKCETERLYGKERIFESYLYPHELKWSSANTFSTGVIFLSKNIQPTKIHSNEAQNFDHLFVVDTLDKIFNAIFGCLFDIFRQKKLNFELVETSYS